MERSRFEELLKAKKPPVLYFMVANIVISGSDGELTVPLVDALMGKTFDFGSILKMAASAEYGVCPDDHNAAWVSLGEYYTKAHTKAPLEWIFENADDAKRACSKAICKFYTDGLHHCHINEKAFIDYMLGR